MRVAIFLLLAFALVSTSATAIAFASDYLVNGSMVLVEGASKIYSISLQNPTDYETGVKIDYDKTFIKIVDYQEVYTLHPRETGYKILFNVTALQKPGEYIVGYTVSEVEPAGGGGLPLRLKINKNFRLKIIEDPKKFHINYFASIYVAVLLIIGLVLFMKLLSRNQKINRKVNK